MERRFTCNIFKISNANQIKELLENNDYLFDTLTYYSLFQNVISDYLIGNKNVLTENIDYYLRDKTRPSYVNSYFPSFDLIVEINNYLKDKNRKSLDKIVKKYKKIIAEKNINYLEDYGNVLSDQISSEYAIYYYDYEASNEILRSEIYNIELMFSGEISECYLSLGTSQIFMNKQNNYAGVNVLRYGRQYYAYKKIANNYKMMKDWNNYEKIMKKAFKMQKSF